MTDHLTVENIRIQFDDHMVSEHEVMKLSATRLSMDFLKSFERLFPSFMKPTRSGWLN